MNSTIDGNTVMKELHIDLKKRYSLLNKEQKAAYLDYLYSHNDLNIMTLYSLITGQFPDYTVPSEIPIIKRDELYEKKSEVQQLKKPTYKNEKGQTKRTNVSEDGQYDKMLYNKIMKWVWTAAKEMGIQQYNILTKQTIRNIAAYRPQTPEELEMIPGIGADKISRYAESIIEMVKSSPSIIPVEKKMEPQKLVPSRLEVEEEPQGAPSRKRFLPPNV